MLLSHGTRQCLLNTVTADQGTRGGCMSDLQYLALECSWSGYLVADAAVVGYCCVTTGVEFPAEMLHEASAASLVAAQCAA